MSAALSPPPAPPGQAPDPWAVVAEEPGAAQHAAVAQGHATRAEAGAQQAELWGNGAVAAATHANRSVDDIKATIQGAMEQMQQIAGQAVAAAQQAMQAAQHATQMASAADKLDEVARTNAQLVASIAHMGQTMTAALAEMRAPRKMVVTKRDADGAVAEAISQVEG